MKNLYKRPITAKDTKPIVNNNPNDGKPITNNNLNDIMVKFIINKVLFSMNITNTKLNHIHSNLNNELKN